MKTLRLVLLIVLALLLPLRGALAATMPCATASGGAIELQRGSPPPAEHEHQHEHEHEHQHPHDHAAMLDHGVGAHGEDAAQPADEPGHHHGSHDSKCNACSAFCSMMPLLSDAPKLPLPPAPTLAAFPALSAPAPSFLSDGQERPPRSL